MIGSSIELVVTNEAELKEADALASRLPIRCIYVMPEMVQVAAVARSLSNGKYLIFAMVDYPKGSKYGIGKFNGTKTDFFLADGYDIILTPDRPKDEIEREIKNIHAFVKEMINNQVNVCYSLNVSMRADEEIEVCSKMFAKSPPSKIKLEASTTVQPTKANAGVHAKTIETIRKFCTTPITVCGNVDYKCYLEFCPKYKIAVSPKQLKDMQRTETESKEETSILPTISDSNEMN